MPGANTCIPGTLGYWEIESMSEVYWWEAELIELFDEHTPTEEVHEVLEEEMSRDSLVSCKVQVFDEESVTAEILREAVRKCVIALAKSMPKVAYCIEPQEPVVGPGARAVKIVASIIPFRVTIAYSAFLPTGETYIDDEGEEQQHTKQGHEIIAHAFVMGEGDCCHDCELS